MMQLIEVEVNPNTRIRDKVVPRVMLGTANTVTRAMIKAIAQHLVKSVPNVAERITLKLCVKVVQNMTNPGPRRDLKRAKSSMR